MLLELNAAFKGCVVAMKIEAQLGSCMARTRYRKQWPSLVKRSWQKKTAGTCSIHFLQQSYSQAARTVPQEEACCLNKLASDRGRACSISTRLFLCNLLRMHNSAVDLLVQFFGQNLVPSYF